MSDSTSPTLPCPSSDFTPPPAGTCVTQEIDEERARQDAKWGEVNIPNGTGPIFAMAAKNAKAVCQASSFDGTVTWDKVLLEEVFEALECEDDARLREELIQVAAVAVAWVECIDRRKAARVPR